MKGSIMLRALLLASLVALSGCETVNRLFSKQPDLKEAVCDYAKQECPTAAGKSPALKLLCDRTAKVCTPAA